MGLATKVGAVDGQLSQPTSSATPPKYRLNTPLTPHKPPKHPLNTPQTPTDVRRCVKLTGASPCHPSYACKTLVVSQVECHAIIPRGERSSRTWPRPCPLDSKTGKLKSTPLLKFFKTALRTQYDMLCNAYTFYGCRDTAGAFHAVDFSVGRGREAGHSVMPSAHSQSRASRCS